MHVHDHQLVGIGSDSDVFKAMSAALDRIEKQAAKEGAKWRGITRRSESIKLMGAKEEQPAVSKPAPQRKIASRKAVRGITATRGGMLAVPTHACSVLISTSAASR